MQYLWPLQNLSNNKFEKKGCFTVSAKDNIDKNATVNLVQYHFHGICMLLFQLLDHENQGESLDCHGFIDAVYNIKKLVPLPAENMEVRFIVLQRNYLLHFVDSIARICLSILKWIYQKLKSTSGYNNLKTQLSQLNHGHSIIYTRNVSSLPLSKILIFYFHCFEVKSIHFTCRFIQWIWT